MQLTTDVQERRGTRWLVVRATPEAQDDTTVGNVEMAGRVAHIELPAQVDLPHPDVRALIALLCVVRGVSREFTLDHPVSPAFATGVEAATGWTVGPVDDAVQPRRRPEDGQRALAYSGGTDCTAAAAVMPRPTGLYFLERVDPVDPAPDDERAGRPSVYDLSAARASCAAMESHGFTVRRVRTDLEHVREPVGFPLDFSNIVPALVWADADRIDGVAWGAPLEAVYRLQVGRFRPFARSGFARWVPLFEACGMDVVNALAGVSEPGTTRIVETWPPGEAAQSCMRGRPGRPCLACWKCARKELLAATEAHRAGRDEDVDLARLERIVTEREPVKKLRQSPLKVEVSLAHTVRAVLAARSGTEPRTPVLDAMEEAIAPVETGFLDRHYPPALEEGVPERFREEVRTRIEEFLEPMDAAEQRQVRQFDARPWWGSPEQVAAHARLQEVIARAEVQPRRQWRAEAGRARRYLARRLLRR